MKAVVINAGPKRRDANAQLVKAAAKGAESAGASVKYVDLLTSAGLLGTILRTDFESGIFVLTV